MAFVMATVAVVIDMVIVSRLLSIVVVKVAHYATSTARFWTKLC